VADNIAITAGSGTNVATDERTIAATTVHVQRVGEIASAGQANGQVTPTTTAATLLAARDTRKFATFVNHTDKEVFIGIATVTTSNGLKLPVGASIDVHSDDLIQCIIASGTATGAIHYVEVYD
jgi:hypothetical protein